MSGIKQNRKQTAKMLGKLGAAAVIATLTGVPTDLCTMLGVQNMGHTAMAAKPPSIAAA